MVLVLDLVAIIFIVIISFMFSINNDKTKLNNSNSNSTKSCLLSNIVIGLSVIVFYKLARYYKLSDKLQNKNESFNSDTITNSINNFVQGSGLITADQAASLSTSDLASYSTKLDNLNSMLANLQSQLATPKQETTAINPSNMNTLDLAAQQQFQVFQIDYLTKQIKNSQDLINAQTVANSSQNYKPIKVFSSCVISNANGTTTEDEFVSGSGSGYSSGDGSTSLTTQQMLQTIGQQQAGGSINGPQLSQPALALSPSTGAIGSFISNIAGMGRQVNIS